MSERETMNGEGENKIDEQPADEAELARVRAEIDAAIDGVGKKAEDPAGDDDESAEAGQESTEGGDTDEESTDDGPPRDTAGRFAPKKDDTLDAPSVSSTVLERAVRAGFTIDEAKQFANDALLSKTLDRIEGQKDASGTAGSPEGAGKKAGEAQPAAPDETIPDLDESEFDPRLVAVVKALKGVNQRQAKELADLRGGRSQDWLASKIDSVKDLTKGEATKVAAVREKFEVLQAGYKAAGKAVPDEAIFGEAAELTLGTKRVRQEEAAGKRSGQRISRPTGRGGETKSSDPWSEVAAEIDRKYFARP